jgi:hypothetical protein
MGQLHHLASWKNVLRRLAGRTCRRRTFVRRPPPPQVETLEDLLLPNTLAGTISDVQGGGNS